MTPYECGTCGSAALRIEPLPEGWRVSCGNGHPIAPSLGTVILAETGPRESIAADLIDAATRPIRPSTIPEHLAEAERLLAFAYSDDDREHAPGGYYVDDDHCTAQVRAAEVHARIAHAAAAAALIRPPREPDPEGSPGAVLLERLTDVLERLAVALEPPPFPGASHVD